MPRWNPAPLLLLLVLAACPAGDSGPEGAPAGSAARFELPFIPDDYAAALAQARERDVPLFVETWAPW